MFYAAINSYANETSTGFANTWGVLAFETRADRDAYVSSRDDLSTQPIARKDIPHYINGEIKPFSGARYIIQHTGQTIDDSGPTGLIGEVAIGYSSDAGRIRDLNQ
jgi:hypothetical protein